MSRHRGRHAAARAGNATTVIAASSAVLAVVSGAVIVRGMASPHHDATRLATLPSAAAAATSSPTLTPTITQSPTVSPSTAAVVATTLNWLAPITPNDTGSLAPGSLPSVLPSPVLIADNHNDRLVVVDPAGRVRWEFPRPGDLAPGQTFRIPDDAFFTPDGQNIIATEEDDFVVTVISIAHHRITYRYGVPGEPGMGPNHLNNPDDAVMLPTGDIVVPDIKNCRIVMIGAGKHEPKHVLGMKTNSCLHAPPARWGSPNGAFPMRNGHYLVTEINGDWVSEVGLDGKVYWSTHPPGIEYPSDTNEIGPDRYLTVDYSSHGQAMIFDHTGKVLWHYAPFSGNGALDHPSLAIGLPNGDVLLNDDYNHRVVVIDPKTNSIVWQYGVTGVPGQREGYLNNPDGLDLMPPLSLLVAHAPTMGTTY